MAAERVKDPWAEAFRRLQFDPWPHVSHHEMAAALARGAYVVRLWRATFDAEDVKPAHILRPPTWRYGTDGGLVWIMSDATSVMGASAGRLVTLAGDIYFAYQCLPAGGLARLYGKERKLAMMATMPTTAAA